MTVSLNWMVRYVSDLETNAVSVERLKEYSETPTEVCGRVLCHKVHRLLQRCVVVVCCVMKYSETPTEMCCIVS